MIIILSWLARTTFMIYYEADEASEKANNCQELKPGHQLAWVTGNLQWVQLVIVCMVAVAQWLAAWARCSRLGFLATDSSSQYWKCSICTSTYFMTCVTSLCASLLQLLWSFVLFWWWLCITVFTFWIMFCAIGWTVACSEQFRFQLLGEVERPEMAWNFVLLTKHDFSLVPDPQFVKDEVRIPSGYRLSPIPTLTRWD